MLFVRSETIPQKSTKSDFNSDLHLGLHMSNSLNFFKLDLGSTNFVSLYNYNLTPNLPFAALGLLTDTQLSVPSSLISDNENLDFASQLFII